MNIREESLQKHYEWNGKIEVVAKAKVNDSKSLSLAYTPGVAEPCKVIAEDKEAAYKYTWKANTVAVVSDGSAVLGLGNIGPYAAMPVMEGKCVLFKEFGNVNAVPICLDTQDTEEIIKTVKNIAPAFGEDDNKVFRGSGVPNVEPIDGQLKFLNGRELSASHTLNSFKSRSLASQPL